VRSWLPIMVWIARLLLCVVFALSAWGKFTDRSGARKAVAEFGSLIQNSFEIKDRLFFENSLISA